ncbi:MAG: hypothetical protein JNG90_02040, partial [Planctomycetaceae bacterium]|nr:hypothetical protein [Planctomycetaceae bacterium]
VAEILRSGRASHLGNVLASAPAGLRLADLNAWADHLRSENWIKLEDPTAPPRAPADSPTAAAGPLRIADVSRCDAAATQPLRRPAGLTDEPARRAGAADPQMFEILDLLDDAVFDALDGRDGALEQLRKVWPQAVRHVGAEILGESKEEYVKRALAHWHQEQAQHPGRDAAAANLLEVLCVVFGA